MPTRQPRPAAVHGITAPAPRVTLQAAGLVFLGLSAAFLFVLAGFTLAIAAIRVF
jgi:hypothetical protein